VEKAATADPDAAMSAAQTRHTPVLAELNAYVARHAANLKMRDGQAINALIEAKDPEFARLYALETKTRMAAAEGDTDTAAAPYVARGAEMATQVDAEIEQFGIAHDLEPAKARERLSKVSSKFAALLKAQAENDVAKRAAVAQVTSHAAGWHTKRQQDAFAAKQRADEEHRRQFFMTPAERELEKRADVIAKARGLTREAATAWALSNDDTAKALYAVYSAEQVAGREMPEALAKALSGAR